MRGVAESGHYSFRVLTKKWSTKCTFIYPVVATCPSKFSQNYPTLVNRKPYCSPPQKENRGKQLQWLDSVLMQRRYLSKLAPIFTVCFRYQRLWWETFFFNENHLQEFVENFFKKMFSHPILWDFPQKITNWLINWLVFYWLSTPCRLFTV